MMLSTIFQQVDHPLIIITQAVGAVGLFRLFFALRRISAPLPQLVGLTALAFLANLTARVSYLDWFFVIDITEYTLLSATIVAAVFCVLHAQRVAATKPDAVPIIPDFFDKIQIKAVWGVGLIVTALTIYAYTKTYLDQRKTSAQVQVAAQQANTRATKEFAQLRAQDNEKDQKVQDSILTAIASISATQGRIIANQTGVLKSQKELKSQVAKTTKEVKKTIQSTVVETRPLEAPKPELKTDEKNLWQKFKGLFGPSARINRADSLSSLQPGIYADTLANF